MDRREVIEVEEKRKCSEKKKGERIVKGRERKRERKKKEDRVKVEVGERERVPTVTERHKGGNWLERERWDMTGGRSRRTSR